ncbi:hypothetical protein CABS03_15209, partial [Colletotrichum abscissum]
QLLQLDYASISPLFCKTRRLAGFHHRCSFSGYAPWVNQESFPPSHDPFEHRTLLFKHLAAHSLTQPALQHRRPLFLSLLCPVVCLAQRLCRNQPYSSLCRQDLPVTVTIDPTSSTLRDQCNAPCGIEPLRTEFPGPELHCTATSISISIHPTLASCKWRA